MSVATASTAGGGGHPSAARAVAAGVPAGIVGGLAFGAAMAQLGVLPTVATLVGLGSSRAGFAVHLAISAVVGAGFGLMVRRQRCGPSETMFLGAAYGALWWCIGPLTLQPLALGHAPAWDVAAAQREFLEETGFTPAPPFLLLGELRQKSGKRITAWAFEGDGDPRDLRSNLFEMEWPPRSGRMQSFPEVDRVGWFTIAQARHKLLPGQVPFLDALEAALAAPP